ncbi:MAG: transposase [Bacilli bacterium]
MCTAAGLASDNNKFFNTLEDRGFIITQSIKKLKKDSKEWALSQDGWRILGHLNKIYNLDDIRNNEELYKNHKETIFYKESEYETKSVKQSLIITFSFKYEIYHKNIRKKQVDRAFKMIKDGTKIEKKKNQNDCVRFIKALHATEDGEIAKKTTYEIDQDIINEESKYDGFYGVTTNLIDETTQVTRVMNGRWQIEQSFRIMKDVFDSGTVHLSKKDRTTAHFLVCFMALFIYRLLEKKLDYKYTVNQIVSCLREMTLRELKGDGYIPNYTRTDLTDDLHRVFGLDTDKEIQSYKKMKKIFKLTRTG